MSMYNPLNGSQPDAGAFKRLRRVETLEYTEQFIYIFHIKADSIVADKHYYLILLVVRRSYFDLGLRTRPREFDGIRNQIDECKSEHGTISVAGGQLANSPNNITPFRFLRNFAKRFLHKLL